MPHRNPNAPVNPYTRGPGTPWAQTQQPNTAREVSHPSFERATPEEAAFRNAIGGLKVGYKGHIPGGKYHFGSSVTGGLPRHESLARNETLHAAMPPPPSRSDAEIRRSSHAKPHLLAQQDATIRQSRLHGINRYAPFGVDASDDTPPPPRAASAPRGRTGGAPALPYRRLYHVDDPVEAARAAYLSVPEEVQNACGLYVQQQGRWGGYSNFGEKIHSELRARSSPVPKRGRSSSVGPQSPRRNTPRTRLAAAQRQRRELPDDGGIDLHRLAELRRPRDEWEPRNAPIDRELLVRRTSPASIAAAAQASAAAAAAIDPFATGLTPRPSSATGSADIAIPHPGWHRLALFDRGGDSGSLLTTAEAGRKGEFGLSRARRVQAAQDAATREIYDRTYGHARGRREYELDQPARSSTTVGGWACSGPDGLQAKIGLQAALATNQHTPRTPRTARTPRGGMGFRLDGARPHGGACQQPLGSAMRASASAPCLGPPGFAGSTSVATSDSGRGGTGGGGNQRGRHQMAIAAR